MKSEPLLTLTRFTSPNPVALICSKPEGRPTNLATVSWYTILSVEPARIGFSLMKSHYTGEIIRETKKAILTIPGESLARNVMECGSSTGRNIDKIEKFKLEMQSVPGSDIEIPVHSVAAVICQLHQFIDVGDHYFHVCDALDTLISENPQETLFAWKGYVKIATVGQMGKN